MASSFDELIFEDETGLHTPDFPTVLQFYIDATKSVFGDDIVLDPDSKDGQYINIFATSAFDMCQVAQDVYNSYSPLTAIGKALSTQVKINGIARRIATFSEVDVDIVGQTGTIITNGIVSDDLSQKWNLPSSVVIPISGTITVTAISQDSGDVSAAPNTVTTIFTPTRGWQTVDNPVASSNGVPVETDGELRIRQTESVSLPALSVFEATLGLVASLDGVARFRGYENDTDFTDSDGIPPHTISIVVKGGDDVEIAQAIADKKTPGTGTFGTTQEAIVDEFGIVNIIKFFRPTDVVIGVNIEIEPLPGFVSTTEELIKISVAEFINAILIGDTVFLSRIYTPANLGSIPEGDTYDITLLELKKDAGPFLAANVDLLFTEIAICDPLIDVVVTLV